MLCYVIHRILYNCVLYCTCMETLNCCELRYCLLLVLCWKLQLFHPAHPVSEHSLDLSPPLHVWAELLHASNYLNKIVLKKNRASKNTVIKTLQLPLSTESRDVYYFSQWFEKSFYNLLLLWSLNKKKIIYCYFMMTKFSIDCNCNF